MKLITDDGKEHDLAFEKIKEEKIATTDIVMIHVKGRFKPKTYSLIADTFRRMFPANEIVVVEWGTEVEIVRRNEMQ